MLKTLDQPNNRMVFAIVLASLVIGSALIVLSGVPPKWHEIPLIGIIGFLGAGIMAFFGCYFRFYGMVRCRRTYVLITITVAAISTSTVGR